MHQSHTLRATALGLSFVMLLGGSGCTTIQNNPRAAKGAGIGAIGGAATGAAIGGIVGGKKGAGQGAAIGAVVGLIGGGLIGSYMDKQAAEMEQVLARQDRIERQQEQLTVVMASDVLFATDSATLQPGARSKLRQLADVMIRYPRTVVQVNGHTDSTGADDYNMQLSVRRADAVADALVANGVSSGRVRVRGLGETLPVADNRNEAGRQQNRRVEIVINPDEGLRDEAAEQGY